MPITRETMPWEPLLDRGEGEPRCCQAGVACHAIVGRNRLDPFEARILDISSVSEATTLSELEERGRALA